MLLLSPKQIKEKKDDEAVKLAKISKELASKTLELNTLRDKTEAEKTRIMARYSEEVDAIRIKKEKLADEICELETRRTEALKPLARQKELLDARESDLKALADEQKAELLRIDQQKKAVSCLDEMLDTKAERLKYEESRLEKLRTETEFAYLEAKEKLGELNNRTIRFDKEMSDFANRKDNFLGGIKEKERHLNLLISEQDKQQKDIKKQVEAVNSERGIIKSAKAELLKDKTEFDNRVEQLLVKAEQFAKYQKQQEQIIETKLLKTKDKETINGILRGQLDEREKSLKDRENILFRRQQTLIEAIKEAKKLNIKL